MQNLVFILILTVCGGSTIGMTGDRVFDSDTQTIVTARGRLPSHDEDRCRLRLLDFEDQVSLDAYLSDHYIGEGAKVQTVGAATLRNITQTLVIEDDPATPGVKRFSKFTNIIK